MVYVDDRDLIELNELHEAGNDSEAKPEVKVKEVT